MPLKAVLAANVLATVTILGPLGIQSNTSITKSSKQSVKWYREIITQFINNYNKYNNWLVQAGYLKDI